MGVPDLSQPFRASTFWRRARYGVHGDRGTWVCLLSQHETNAHAAYFTRKLMTKEEILAQIREVSTHPEVIQICVQLAHSFKSGDSTRETIRKGADDVLGILAVLNDDLDDLIEDALKIGREEISLRASMAQSAMDSMNEMPAVDPDEVFDIRPAIARWECQICGNWNPPAVRCVGEPSTLGASVCWEPPPPPSPINTDPPRYECPCCGNRNRFDSLCLGQVDGQMCGFNPLTGS